MRPHFSFLDRSALTALCPLFSVLCPVYYFLLFNFYFSSDRCFGFSDVSVCISAAPAALDRYLAAVPAMSLIPFAPFSISASQFF